MALGLGGVWPLQSYVLVGFVRRIRHPVRPVENENKVRDRESGCEESEKDSMNSDALRPIRALLAPRSHYDNEDYGADEAIQGG